MPPRYIDPEALEAREDEILKKALAIISEQGIVALTMDKLVGQLDYSKGTVYNHFSSKEDVLAGLCNRNMMNVRNLFARVAQLNISPRDKMTGIGFAYMLSVLLAPQHFSLVMNAKTELFEKASENRREKHEALETELFGHIHRIIDEAVAQKELSLDESIVPQQIAFSLWAMSFGTIGLLLNGGKSCDTMTGMILEDRVITHGNIVMDGLGWKPSQRDKHELINWFKTDIFKQEIDQLEK